MPKNRIEMLRNQAELKRVDIASRLGVVEMTVMRWERGDTQIPDQQKLALAQMFNVSVPFLMNWPETNGETAA